MNIIEAELREVEIKDYKNRSAVESDADIVIDQDTLVRVNGVNKILYKKIDADTRGVRWAVRNIEYGTTTRTNGLKTTSAVFGYLPKVAVRRDYCTSTSMSRRFPKQHYIICEFAEALAEMYKEYFPEVFEAHKKVVAEKVEHDWVIKDTPFTSGIINKNNELNYHHDAGNFKEVLSNMLIFKRGVNGGRLVCPEFNLKFECRDDYVVIFDGQSILHGVTPIYKDKEESYRYTLVYYSMQQMWNCDNLNGELERIRKLKKEREHKRLK